MNIERYLRKNEPMAHHTSLKVGGPADLFLVADSDELAIEGLLFARHNGLPCLVIGGGSNLLVSDYGVQGLVIKMTTSQVHVRPAPAGEEAVVEAASGCGFSGLARRLAHLGWSGLEWAVNVPGTVGGAVVNNAGAFGGCTADSLINCKVASDTGVITEYPVTQLRYRYRNSILKQRSLGPIVVLSAQFRIQRGDPGQLRRTIAELQARRTSTQPRQLSAGSVFVNPPGDFAGRLIEEAGLKGARLGGAEVSPRHGNFIVNTGGATASEVYQLMRLVQDTVWRKTGVWLEPEIQMVGRWSSEAMENLLSRQK